MRRPRCFDRVRGAILARADERGQVLVIFAISLFAVIAGTGLVLDGGFAMVERREQQSAADFAALGGGIAYANEDGGYADRSEAARTRALQLANANGYVVGLRDGLVTSVTVTATADVDSGAVFVDVTVARPQTNFFAGIIGQPTWEISARAKAVVGIPNAAVGAMPVIFNQKAFDDERPRNMSSPGVLYDQPHGAPGGVPQDSTTFNWTTFCTGASGCSVDSDTVRTLIEQGGVAHAVEIGDDISPLNNGSHTSLFGSMEQWIGTEFPVALVDDGGHMVGWAMFHLDSVQGGSQKVLGGWFVSDANALPLRMVGCTGYGSCAATTGTYVIRLTE